jgi:antitoxin MazE
MKVAKWGNSLAIRIPADVVHALGLKEGDEVELAADGGAWRLSRDDRRERALEALRSLRGALPADYRFDRDEANAR